MSAQLDQLVEKMRRGERRALGRLLTIVEQGGAQAVQALEAVHRYTGGAYVIGVTGPPGAGKSTTVDRLIALYRAAGKSVGVLAVDPTSPFTGGAFLGDRIRMQQHFLDSGVFIRSMATRGGVGGLPRMVKASIRALDASAKDIIIVETVGVGQTEVEVMQVVDTVVVVLVPEAGDAIQTMKAGLLEIADIFVVNKADRPGAGRLVSELEAMLHMAEKAPWWQPAVMEAQALNDVGVDQLFRVIQEHEQALKGSSNLTRKRRERQRQEFFTTLEEEAGVLLKRLTAREGEVAAVLTKVEQGEEDPYVAAARVLSDGAFLRDWMAERGRRPNAGDG
ncbi:MAG: methylmalonyl Co-A mutase-associated GTPase MeaB [Dehalococcoidia bacterium]|nr:methylmalonyl Co-A mutase-associated GTPase MeaB [Dehalococcoidia bacterium]